MQLTVPAAALDFALFDGALPLGSRRSERMAKSVASAEENNIKKRDGTCVMHAANRDELNNKEGLSLSAVLAEKGRTVSPAKCYNVSSKMTLLGGLD